MEKLFLVHAATKKQMSGDNDFAVTFTFNKTTNPKVSFDKISANQYAACYDNNWWVG